MSVFSKKPLIKQQTVYDGEENAKSKMSFTTKRVSFDSTTVQSDSDEENSLGRSNRKPVKPNADDDDLLNMFRSELSDSEDDILQTRSEVKSKGVVEKPSPVPRYLKSASSTRDFKTLTTRSVNQPTDVLDQTIHPKHKAKPKPQPRKMSGNIQSEEESPRSSKPEVTPRKQQSASTHHEQHIYDMRRKSKPRHDFSDSDDDDIVVNSRTDNHKLSKISNQLEVRESSIQKGSGKMKKESSEEDEYIDQDIVHTTSILKKTDESSYSRNKLDKGQDERKKVKSFQLGESVDKEDIAFVKPAPKPRRHIQDNGIHDYKSHNDDEDNENIEIDKDTSRHLKKVPVPKARKEHLLESQEKEIVSKSMLSKSKLHYLDDNDSGEETHMKIVDKGGQVSNRSKNGLTEDKVDGNTLDWSSLDESDDDEAVGKKVNLFKKQRPSSAKAIDDNNNKEISKVPKPSPRSKPRRELGNVQQHRQNDTSKNTLNHYKDLNSTDYDSYQRVTRERSDRDRRARGNATPQRPGSSKARSNGWGRDREEDITDMFEEHIPDSNDLIGVDHKQFWHSKDQLRPRSSTTPKKGPMKADQGIEEMTRSPHLRQTLRHTDDQDLDNPFQPSVWRQKSSSLTNLYRIGDSDYRNYDEDESPTQRRNSLDTETIRQTVYDNWLSRKTVTIKKELSKKALEKQKEQEKIKEEEERKKSAQLAFQSWTQHKTETLKEQYAKIKAKQKEEQEKMELERRMKEKDSKKYFESWKSKKDALIKETHKERMNKEKMKKKKDEEEKLEKTMSSKKSFENWKSKKDTVLKQQLKEKKKKEKVEEAKKEEESYEKTIKNADEFQKWAENKGKPRKKPAPPTLKQRAWVPGSRNTSDSCIPSTVQPVVLPASTNRARTMSGTYRGKTKYYDF